MPSSDSETGDVDLLGVDRLDGDVGLFQELLRRFEQIVATARHGGELDGTPGRQQSTVGLRDQTAKCRRLVFRQEDRQDCRSVQNDYFGKPRSS